MQSIKINCFDHLAFALSVWLKVKQEGNSVTSQHKTVLCNPPSSVTYTSKPPLRFCSQKIKEKEINTTSERLLGQPRLALLLQASEGDWGYSGDSLVNT